ncbi:MAG: metallophosphoesterase [Suipraeoptans sp.]
MSIIVIIFLIILLLMIFEIRRELCIFQVNHYIAAYSKLDTLKEEKKILFLSDLHNQVYGENNDSLLEKIRAEKPALILIGGDMLIGKKGYTYDTALDFVRELPPIAPVYYANGNHEQRMKERPDNYGFGYIKYKKELINAGVNFLENESATIYFDDIPIHITGIEIPLKNYKHFTTPKLIQKEISKRIGERAKVGFNILLAHNPSYMDSYKKWGADLILSGHFHGGIIRIPGVRGLVIPGFGSHKKYSGGIFLEGDQRIIVSKGLGNHTIRIRLFNKAEVVALHLRRKTTHNM